MDHAFAYEQSQNTLRQRNLLGLACLALFGTCIALTVVATNPDREVILQPVVAKQMSISSGGVSRDYLEAVTRDAALLTLNRSPETLQYWMDAILAITAPEARGGLKAKLAAIVAEQQGSQVTQFLTIDWIQVDPGTLTSEIGGVLHTVVASRDVRREQRTFRFKWKYEGLSLKLLGFGVVLKKDEAP
ncbi:type IV conjugative transfer system protein TraE [Novosphingobium sp. P6W]|uniref:type IV conjugative transfer system protein TraE n=1 Tax=Novosphingobium sp. P6W TaxID=1609758 RepID=UPI0005C3222C|nr:type IV conjugative transfer system protein TraE [Novosphingobium sp. P6W]AXB80456.1 conjugal transfer protein TraE [Novosphingobium sp. P6W]KIS31285.1 conjugal transfer protein TraE [Novosphingobium sp. P6W]